MFLSLKNRNLKTKVDGLRFKTVVLTKTNIGKQDTASMIYHLKNGSELITDMINMFLEDGITFKNSFFDGGLVLKKASF